MNAHDLTVVRETGVIAVVRAPSAALARRAIDAVVAGGVRGIEVTFTVPDAATLIADLARDYGSDILLGAGTLTTPDDVQRAADAGALFLVSPGFAPELGAAMRATGLTTMAGALTPSEVMAVRGAGMDVVKVFPASLGGPSYLRALRGPFPDVPLMPTGGVNAGNVAEWLAAGAIAVGAGGELVSSADLAAEDFSSTRRRAQQFTEALEQARKEAGA
jgi:2-dehydro-3-deoxyphosphogluconate aldolase/(4S)-4-hydroxy-2-oxoglutarate aldolase